MGTKINIIFLCGGTGSRLWPLSTPDYPKQFLSIQDGKSLLYQSISRILELENLQIKIESMIFVTNEKYQFMIKDHLPKSINKKIEIKIINESEKKNTAPALTLSCLELKYTNKSNKPTLVLSTDHFFDNIKNFSDKILHAINELEKKSISLFGVKPEGCNTELGYIIPQKRDSECSYKHGEIVDKFIEKPSIEKLRTLSNKNNIYVNLGIFLLYPEDWLNVVKENKNKLYTQIEKTFNSRKSKDGFISFSNNVFKKINPISIDYAVVEKFKLYNLLLKFYEVNSKWSDLGTWKAIYNYANKDKDGNALMDYEHNNLLINSKNNLIDSNNIILNNVNNLVVVNKDNKLYISNFKSLPDDLLLEDHFNYFLKLPKTYEKRPWGSFQILNDGSGYKVKKIIVLPGCSLSLQSHNKRSEHWIVIEGSATVQNDNKTFILKKNCSTFINKNTKHRLTNKSRKNKLIIIEVQSGSYLGEDDIIRYEDKYSRV